MQFTNANIFTRDFTFRWGSFCVEDGKFTRVLAEGEAAADAVDLQGAYVIPGLIDVHNHGNSNADFSDGSYEGLVKMARYLAKNGITSFAPASMTLPYETLAKAFATARTLVDEAPAGCAALRGIQMEGPFFSEKKKGAQNGAYLKDPDFAAFRKLQEGCGGLIKIVDVAAELPGAVEFAAQAKELSNVSIAHSDSDYEHALAVFEAGARHLTHLYNAMNPLGHRAPGVIAAAADDPLCMAEMIGDGIHIHPAVVRNTFRMFGEERIVLISDSMMAAGMENGVYELGGQKVIMNNRKAVLEDGTIAGSATNLYECMQCVIAMGVPEHTAIFAATRNPAKSIGIYGEVGSLVPGKRADMVLADEKLNIVRVI